MYGKGICQLTELTGCLENQAQKMKAQGSLYKTKMIQDFFPLLLRIYLKEEFVIFLLKNELYKKWQRWEGKSACWGKTKGKN